MKRAALVVVTLASVTKAALAQQPAPAPLPQPQPAQAPQPGAVPQTAPPVSDPMLESPKAAARNLRTWEDAMALVRARSTDLRIAVDDVVRAEGQSRVALAAALPSINGNVNGTYNILTKTGSQVCQVNGQPSLCPIDLPIRQSLDANVQLSQPVVNLRVWYNIGTANRVADASRLTLADAKRTITLNVANSIVGVFTAERVTELNRIGLRNALERLELSRRRQTFGSGNGLDVIRAQQDVESARASLVTSDESLRQSREALGLALGLTEAVGVTHDLDLDGLQKSAMSTCKNVGTVEDRADVAALSARAKIAERAHTEVKLQFVPTVTVTSSLATTSRDTGAAPSTTWNIQGLLNWNIWDGGARYGTLRDTDAQRDQADMRLEAQKRKASLEVTQAQRGVVVAEQARTVAESARNLASDVDRLTRVAFAEGRGTSLELITAATALRQAEVQLALREFELVRARLTATLATAVCSF
ncbi:MAG: TolC family protein [Polyangiaceae bacterium]|nr:TolC family protein [Polyangiaceae bacterium]